MTIKSKENSIGAWSFLIGVLLAIMIGVSTSSFLSIESVSKYSTQIYGILLLLGIFVGFSIKIAAWRDAQTFLYSGAIIVIISKFGMESVSGSLIGIGIGDVVSSTFGALLALFVPATMIVALKTVFSIARVQ